MNYYKSKLAPLPDFSPLPKYYGAANVEENIMRWIDKNDEESLNTFCRKDPTKKSGYRFVNSEDFKEIIDETRKIMGVNVQFTFIRKVHTTDHFCPLYFSVWYHAVAYSIGDDTEEYISDAQLKRFIKLHKP
jgi:hypothetical protein